MTGMNARGLLRSETGSEIVNETGIVIGSEIETGIVIECAIGNAILSVVTRGEHYGAP